MTPIEILQRLNQYDLSQYNGTSDDAAYYITREVCEYFKSKSTPQIAWDECERGDWMLWVASNLGVKSRRLVACKAACVETVRHLVEKHGGIDSLDAAHAYGRGEIGEKELCRYEFNNHNYSLHAATHAAGAAAYPYSHLSAYWAGAATATASAVVSDLGMNAAKEASLLITADICRNMLEKDMYIILTPHNVKRNNLFDRLFKRRKDK